MGEIGIRALKQNASAVVAQVAAGETMTVTDRGRPVAQVAPLPASPLTGMLDRGAARAPKRALKDLPDPVHGPPLSAVLAAMRDDERF